MSILLRYKLVAAAIVYGVFFFVLVLVYFALIRPLAPSAYNIHLFTLFLALFDLGANAAFLYGVITNIGNLVEYLPDWTVIVALFALPLFINAIGLIYMRVVIGKDADFDDWNRAGANRVSTFLSFFLGLKNGEAVLLMGSGALRLGWTSAPIPEHIVTVAHWMSWAAVFYESVPHLVIILYFAIVQQAWDLDFPTSIALISAGCYMLYSLLRRPIMLRFQDHEETKEVIETGSWYRGSTEEPDPPLYEMD